VTNHPRRRRRDRADRTVFVVVVGDTLVTHLGQPDPAGVMRAICPAGRDLDLDLRPSPPATDLGPPQLAWCGECRRYFDYLHDQVQLAETAQRNGRRR
jgi:hypothetical protein